MSALIVDVREQHEYKQVHVAGAINVPLSKDDEYFQHKVVDRDTEIIVYCRSGSRSGMAVAYLRSIGYRHVTNGVNQEAIEGRHA